MKLLMTEFINLIPGFNPNSIIMKTISGMTIKDHLDGIDIIM